MSDATRVALLGCTGSIGRQTLDVLATACPDRFEVVALAAGQERADLQRAGRPRFAPRAATASSRQRDGARRARGDRHAATTWTCRRGHDAASSACAPSWPRSERGKVVATANKETLVAGGHLVMPLARAARRAPATHDLAAERRWPGCGRSTREHSAIWQCLAGERLDDVARLILTASGGPFRDWPAERLEVGDARARRWPTQRGAWARKITIDSATLMNKGLEVIEARWLYDFGDERIDVVVHPQSIVHSLVEFVDGSLKAQLGLPDMRIPIQYAADLPARISARRRRGST